MLKELNPIIHSELRLAILSILIAAEETDFVYIKKQTNSTSGNLSIQLEKLNQAKYISIEKGYAGKRPRTTCRITEEGKKAFGEYVEAIETYLKHPAAR